MPGGLRSRKQRLGRLGPRVLQLLQQGCVLRVQGEGLGRGGSVSAVVHHASPCCGAVMVLLAVVLLCLKRARQSRAGKLAM